MRVTVTGAAGTLGRVVVARLLERGYEVLGVDTRPVDIAGARTLPVDLRDLGQVYGALAGAGAVVHAGAIPAAGMRTPEMIYANNVEGTFNVFEAAATLGIRRVVYASSVAALGFPFQYRQSEPLYVPIDEAHPLLPQDPYALSKAAGEETAAAYARRGAGSAASLRFSTILHPRNYRQFIDRARDDPGASAPLLWSYVDLRDAVDACVLALTAPFEGHEPLYVTADDTTSALPTDLLLERYFPTVPRRPGDRPERWSLLDVARAAEVIGYRPRHRWRGALAEIEAAG